MSRKIPGFFVAVLLASALAAAGEPQAPSACWFLRDANRQAPVPSALKSVKIDNFFRVFYPGSESRFQDSDRNGIPDILDKNSDVFARSRYLLQTILAWRVPATRIEMGKPELNVYFLPLPSDFAGTVRSDRELRILLNQSVLDSREFPATWIHFLTHAVELQYRTSGDYWFFEATAGWMEGQFDGYSRATVTAHLFRFNRPRIPIKDATPLSALGASRFVDSLSRPHKDVIRQIWDQWSYAGDEDLIKIIQKVLVLNHLPGFSSYLQNYFLQATPTIRLLRDMTDVVIPSYAALVFRGIPEQHQGGAFLQFTPVGSRSYSANVLYYDQEKTGTLAMKMGTTEPWSIRLPYAGMESFSLVIVNTSSVELRGRIRMSFDGTIPAVLEYFKASPQQDGISVEWKTNRENGVAFWNLYRSQNGRRIRVNDFPIPATIDSDQGIHYLFLDSSAGALYWLEAITEQGLPSELAITEP